MNIIKKLVQSTIGMQEAAEEIRGLQSNTNYGYIYKKGDDTLIVEAIDIELSTLLAWKILGDNIGIPECFDLNSIELWLSFVRDSGDSLLWLDKDRVLRVYDKLSGHWEVI